MPIPPIRPEDHRAPTGGIVRAPRRPPGWTAPGPRPRLAEAMPGSTFAVDEALWPSAEEDLCWLAGDFRILQRLDGHRWSLDDLVTAWVASRLGGDPKRICDLGCGIGTVLLFLAWRFPQARLVGVEAQAQSAALARRSLVWNDVTDRVEVRSGDLRDAHVVPDGPFELVTGTPPYFPPGTGVESTRPQCAPCRFEHRGGVEAYVEAAARLVAPGGRAVLCQGASQTHRVAPSAEAAGLTVEAQLDVIPRAGKPVLISIFTLARSLPSIAPSGAARRREPTAEARGTTRETLLVREADGRWTDAFRVVRAELGMPPGRHD